MLHVLAVIPARLGSTRLPRKPLHLLAGRPLIEWVWRRAVAADLFERMGSGMEVYRVRHQRVIEAIDRISS